MSTAKTIVLGVTGSIAAYKAVDIASLLFKAGHNIHAVMTADALKIARADTKRAGVLCFEGGYPGRTLLTLSLTSKYGLFKQGFGPFAPEIYRIPAPEPYRRPAGLSEEAYVATCIASL